MEEAEKNKKCQDLLINENKEYVNLINQRNETIFVLQNEIESLKHGIFDRNREIEILKQQLAATGETTRSNEQLKLDIIECNESRVKLQQKFEQALIDHKQQLQSEYLQRQQLIKEKEETY